jgi:hypothetical protein
MKLIHEKNDRCRILFLKIQKLITFSPQKRKHNTKLEEKRPKKTLKKIMQKFFLHKIICLMQKKSNIVQKIVKIL